MDELTLSVLELARAQHDGEARPVEGPDTELREAGFGSLETVRLMLAVESHFSVRFPSEMMDSAVFRTPRTVAEAVRALQAGTG